MVEEASCMGGHLPRSSMHGCVVSHQQLAHDGGWRGWRIDGMMHRGAGGSLEDKPDEMEGQRILLPTEKVWEKKKRIFGGYSFRMRRWGFLGVAWEKMRVSFPKIVREKQGRNRLGFIISHLRFSTFNSFCFMFSHTLLPSNIWMFVLII